MGGLNEKIFMVRQDVKRLNANPPMLLTILEPGPFVANTLGQHGWAWLKLGRSSSFSGKTD